MLHPKYCPRWWRRRTLGSVCRVISKYSLPRQHQRALRSPARAADAQTSRRDFTVIRGAVRKSKTFIHRPRRRNRSLPYRRFQNPSRSQWPWIFAATGTRINWRRSRRSRSLLCKIPRRIQTSRRGRRPRRWNVAVELLHVTYAAGNSAPPAFPYTSPSAWR